MLNCSLKSGAYRRDFLTGLFEALFTGALLFASRRFDDDVLWNIFRKADNTRSFGRNDMLIQKRFLCLKRKECHCNHLFITYIYLLTE